MSDTENKPQDNAPAANTAPETVSTADSNAALLAAINSLVSEVKDLKTASAVEPKTVTEEPKPAVAPTANVEAGKELKDLTDAVSCFKSEMATLAEKVAAMDSLKAELTAVKAELAAAKTELAEKATKAELAAAKSVDVPTTNNLANQIDKGDAVVKTDALSASADPFIAKLLD